MTQLSEKIEYKKDAYGAMEEVAPKDQSSKPAPAAKKGKEDSTVPNRSPIPFALMVFGIPFVLLIIAGWAMGHC